MNPSYYMDTSPGKFAPAGIRRDIERPKLALPKGLEPPEHRAAAIAEVFGQPSNEGIELYKAAHATSVAACKEHVEPLAKAWFEAGGTSETCPSKKAVFDKLIALTSLWFDGSAFLLRFHTSPREIPEVLANRQQSDVVSTPWLPSLPWAILHAAYFAVVDEAVDEELQNVNPAERLLVANQLLYQNNEKNTSSVGPCWSLLLAIIERVEYFNEQVGSQIHPYRPSVLAYCKEELRRVERRPDKYGLFNRTGSVIGVGRSWGAFGHIDADALEWGVGAGWLIQIVDDLLDAEEDLAVNRETGVTAGYWSVDTVRHLVSSLRSSLVANTEDHKLAGILWDAFASLFLHFIQPELVQR